MLQGKECKPVRGPFHEIRVQRHLPDEIVITGSSKIAEMICITKWASTD
jgi:hypothetical protein